MRLGVRFFLDPFAYYRHDPSDRTMLLALYEIETAQPIFVAAKQAAVPAGRSNAKAAKGLKPTSLAAIERLRGGL